MGRLSSPAHEPLDALRHHFRQFSMVELPDRKQVYFRFYDPRVLRVFLPTCTAEETKQFFGPVKHYRMEDENPEMLLEFASSGHALARKMVSLVLAHRAGDQTFER